MSDKFPTSRALLERARQSLAGGVSSPFRARVSVPLYFKDGRGSRLWDVDGNQFIDYTLAWGPNILGYRHPAIVEAMRQAADAPHTYGAQHEAEYLVSETMQRLVPCAERVAFTSSGSEAVQLAMRLARAATGRWKILKFEGHYHGWMDSALLSYHPSAAQVGPPDSPSVVPASLGQLPNSADNVVVVRWNDGAALERALETHASEIAAVFMEPVLCNSGCILPREGYLALARELTRRHGALLIFDEVITGFRHSLGGAQASYNVTPDIATFGKAMGGGLTLSAIAGRRDLMELIAGGGVSFGGTFNGNPVSLAGALATLAELSRDHGAALVRANRTGQLLMEGIRQLARAQSIPLLISGFGAAFALHFTQRTELHEYRDTFDDDPEPLARFLLYALEEGVNALPDGRFYVSAVHTQADVDQTLQAAERAFRRLNSGTAQP